MDQLGYRYNVTTEDARPTVVEAVTPVYVPQVTPVATSTQVIGLSRISCFGAGTAVRTLTGPRPIETLSIISLRLVTLDVPPQDIITKDNVSVKVNAVCYFKVVDANRALREIEN